MVKCAPEGGAVYPLGRIQTFVLINEETAGISHGNRLVPGCKGGQKRGKKAKGRGGGGRTYLKEDNSDKGKKVAEPIGF